MNWLKKLTNIFKKNVKSATTAAAPIKPPKMPKAPKMPSIPTSTERWAMPTFQPTGSIADDLESDKAVIQKRISRARIGSEVLGTSDVNWLNSIDDEEARMAREADLIESLMRQGKYVYVENGQVKWLEEPAVQEEWNIDIAAATGGARTNSDFVGY